MVAAIEGGFDGVSVLDINAEDVGDEAFNEGKFFVALAEDGFDAFWDGLETAEGTVQKRLRRSIARFSSETGTGGRILDNQEEDYDEDEARVEAQERLKWFWARLGLPK